MKISGVVKLGDEYRCDDDWKEGAVHIGEVDVVYFISKNFSGDVVIGIADESFSGELFVDTGWGYSEWTPVDSDSLKVGGHDIIEILRRYEGEEVSMFVSKEPINILDEEIK